MTLRFELGEQPYIELYKLIKVLDLVDNGGEAKALVAGGVVLRGGEVETRKRAKIIKGETITLGEVSITVQ